eukprot:NODE_686_length_4746_cov_0.370562.p2 type:complete len:162 gc:universal NODE_686_length_4746_cov_0.370562:863-378(-)
MLFNFPFNFQLRCKPKSSFMKKYIRPIYRADTRERNILRLTFYSEYNIKKKFKAQNFFEAAIHGQYIAKDTYQLTFGEWPSTNRNDNNNPDFLKEIEYSNFLVSEIKANVDTIEEPFEYIKGNGIITFDEMGKLNMEPVEFKAQNFIVRCKIESLQKNLMK